MRMIMDLTARQLEVIKHLVQGRSDKEIGLLLGIMTGTVHNHVTMARERLGAQSREQLIALVVSRGMITVDDCRLDCGHMGEGFEVTWKAQAIHEDDDEFSRVVVTGQVCELCRVHMMGFKLLLRDREEQEAWLAGELPEPAVWW